MFRISRGSLAGWMVGQAIIIGLLLTLPGPPASAGEIRPITQSPLAIHRGVSTPRLPGPVWGHGGRPPAGPVGGSPIGQTNGNSAAALFNATKQMQQTQQSFNLQYLQLQSQMQNDNKLSATR